MPRMEEIDGASPPSTCDRVTGEIAARDGALPLRPVPDFLVYRRVRYMDDPEILERVLAGLLELR